jgi:hypothetical protein
MASTGLQNEAVIPLQDKWFLKTLEHIDERTDQASKIRLALSKP